jgi:hypothetical protein
MVRRRPALHRLPHYMSMNTRPYLPGIVERLENAIDILFIQFPVKLRKPQIKAYQQRAFHAVDGKIRKPITRRKTPQVTFRAKSLVIPVNNPALGIDYIKTIVRLIRLSQPVCTSQNHPKAEFGRKFHNLFSLFFKQSPIVPVEVGKVGAYIAAESTLGEMNNISFRFFRPVQKLTNPLGVSFNGATYSKLTRRNF